LFREAAKKVIIFSGSAIKALPPTPSSLVAIFTGEFFFELQKKFFFLSGQVLTAYLPTPPLLVAGPLKKNNFFGFLYFKPQNYTPPNTYAL